MKFKAVVSSEAPQSFTHALDQLRERLEHNVVAGCFGVPMGTLGPAEMYVQGTDLQYGQEPAINYNASGITIKAGRDFKRALLAIKAIILDLITGRWSRVGKIQIMIVIHASSGDGKISGLAELSLWFDSKTREVTNEKFSVDF